MRIAISVIAAGFLILAPDSAHPQHPTTLLAAPPRFESWKPEGMPSNRISATIGRPAAARPRGRNALIGAAIGTVAGLAFCTVVSNIANDPGTGFSTCTRDGYLLTGGVGLTLGLVIGLIA
ncbi:MAG: hypothetical protein H0T68_01135 [Gemmatimonadales bacterium]|nr:hypothetical protein [Gemmatimonadales bacterium]